MAKSKNHTNHNQNRKAHRNGIKKPKFDKNPSTKGMDRKFLRNLKFSRKHNVSGTKQRKLANLKMKRQFLKQLAPKMVKTDVKTVEVKP
uniref:60S ribosomal protein L29 n=1 Tax=Strigamia maritima TaxID=126957 RepID=T1JJ66_STRMM